VDGENRQLVPDEPAEAEGSRKITDHFERNLENIPQMCKENVKDVSMSPAGLGNARMSTDYAQKSPPTLVRPLARGPVPAAARRSLRPVEAGCGALGDAWRGAGQCGQRTSSAD
jgi:hypothetical protein